jgi:hypothetical protein
VYQAAEDDSCHASDGDDSGRKHRHRAEERHFEMIAGKVVHADGGQHRFACPRIGPMAMTETFRAALTAAAMCT